MAPRSILLGALALLALLGGAFLVLSPKSGGGGLGASADSGGESLHSMIHQRAIMACLLAATYGAERGAKIKQAEAVLASLPPQLDAASAAEADAIAKLLPLNKTERDASYDLYFRGVAALARGDEDEVESSLDTIEDELNKAGLVRLVRYVKPVRAQIAAARDGGVPKDSHEQWIKELEDAVLSQY